MINSRANIIKTYQQALSQERLAVLRYWKENGFRISNVQLFKREGGDYFYSGQVENLEDGEQIPIPEGIRIRLVFRKGDYLTRDSLDEVLMGTFLAFDDIEGLLYFSTNNGLENLTVFPRFIKVEPMADLFIDLVLKKLPQLLLTESLGWDIIEQKMGKIAPYYNLNGLTQYELKLSQKEAIKDIYQQRVTLIWGPPGTGKTTTIATAICDMLSQGKRILAVAISNVAVDQIALKVLNVKGDFNHGEVIRFGMPRLSDIYAKSILFPNREIVTKLREQIYNTRDLIKKTNNVQDKAVYQRKLNELQLTLKNAIVDSLSHARLTLTTSAQVLMEESFELQDYDIVIIDEASMMSLPTMAVLSLFARKKLVVAGDYKQLGPIVISKKKEVRDVLEMNAFDAVTRKNKRFSFLSILKTQHRMNEPICELVNNNFYSGILFSHITEINRRGAAVKPAAGEPLVFIRATAKDTSITKMTFRNSRYNEFTAELCVKMAIKMIRQPAVNVGVITPYRVQAQSIKEQIKRMVKTGKLVKTQGERIKVGTIHAFQGDESDIIIFDLVDTKEKGPGALYKKRTGEYLVNVAFSRAKGKLVVVGDPELFKDDPKGEYPLLQTIFRSTPFVFIECYSILKGG